MPSIVDSLKQWLGGKGGLPPASRPTVLVSDEGLEFEVMQTRRGGMGVVHLCLARHRVGGGPPEDPGELQVALKTFDDEFFFNAAMADVVSRETSVWARLANVPFVLPLLSIVTIDKKPHLMMPTVQADANGVHSLAGLIRNSVHGLHPSECLCAALCMAIAMTKAAERIAGVVHGDIKPDNVLMFGGSAFLADFGLAGIASERGQRGTPGFMAPELWNEGGKQSVQTDVYAFGATLAEMLSGKPPFQVLDNGPKDWARAHALATPQVACHPTWRDEPLAKALVALAVDCLRKDFQARPSDFKSIMESLIAAGLRSEPGATLDILRIAADLVANAGEQRRSRVELHVKALLKQQQYVAALDVLKELPEEEVTGNLLLLAGTTWSLAGDDETALGYFDRFLVNGPGDDERIHCLSEKGLSLRRLDRLEEARALFEDLAAETVGMKEAHERVRTNLAGTLLDLGRNQEAIRQLEWLVRNHPRTAQSRMLYADALARSGNLTDAIRMVESATALDPRNGYYQVVRADMLLTGGDPEEALHAVDKAYELGHHSVQWLVLALAVNMILARKDDVAGLLEALNRDVSGDLREMLLQESFGRVREWMQRQGHSVTDADRPEAGHLSADESATPGAPPETEPAYPDASDPHDVEAHRANIRNGRSAHVQVHVAVDESAFTVDFYGDVKASDYVEKFQSGYSRTKWRFEGGTTAESHARFRFAQCGHCGFLILTARDEGQRLTCQACGERGTVTSASAAGLDALADACSLAVGRHSASAAPEGESLFVAVWEDQPERFAKIAQRLAAAGFLPAPEGCGAFALFQAERMQRQTEPVNLPTEVWHRPTSSEDGVAGEMSPALDRLLRGLRRDIGDVMSASVKFRDHYRDMMLADAPARLELIRRVAQDHPAELGIKDALVAELLRQGQVAEAARIAAAMRFAYPDDADTTICSARVLIATSQAPAAIATLEQLVARLPRNRNARMLLMEAHQACGNTADLHRHGVELRALGLPGLE